MVRLPLWPISRGGGDTSNPSCKMTKRQPLFSGPGARDVDRTTGRNVSSITLDFNARQIAVSCFDLLFSSFSCMCVCIFYTTTLIRLRLIGKTVVCFFVLVFYVYGKKLATVKDLKEKTHRILSTADRESLVDRSLAANQLLRMEKNLLCLRLFLLSSFVVVTIKNNK